MDHVSQAQSLQVDPATARVASMLRKTVGAPRIVVEYFVMTDPDGVEVRASTSDLLAVLEDFRGSSQEPPETYFSRLASRLREQFR